MTSVTHILLNVTQVSKVVESHVPQYVMIWKVQHLALIQPISQRNPSMELESIPKANMREVSLAHALTHS